MADMDSSSANDENGYGYGYDVAYGESYEESMKRFRDEAARDNPEKSSKADRSQ